MKTKTGATSSYELQSGDLRLTISFQFNGAGAYMRHKIDHLFDKQYDRMTAKNFLALGELYKELGELMKEAQNV